MDINTIIKLVDAGYTRAEIDQITSGNSSAGGSVLVAPEEPQSPESVIDPSSEISGQAEPPLESNNELNKLSDIVADLSQQVIKLTKQVQNNNIINSEQPPKPVETAADILASIINPYLKKEK